MKKIILLILICIGYLYPQASNTIPRRVDTLETDVDSLYTYWVNTHEAQTITGHKAFTGTINIAPDTSMWLGYKDGNYNTGLTIWEKSSHPYGFNRIFKSIPLDTATASWSLATGTTDFKPANNGYDHQINLGYNWDGYKLKPQWGFQLEAQYEYADTINIYEWFSYFNNLPPAYKTYGVRTFQVSVYQGQQGYYSSRMTVDADEFIIGRDGYGIDNFRFNRNAFLIQNNAYIIGNNNNSPFLYQRLSGGNSANMLMIDNTDNLVLAPSGAINAVDFGQPISKEEDETIRWDNNAGTDEITIYPDTTDRLQIGSGGGVSVNNIDVTYFPEDTTGLVSGKLYLDNGFLRYTLPSNIFINGDFSSWTGTGNSTRPVGWNFNWDTTHIQFVNNSDQLEIISDGAVQLSTWGNFTLTSLDVGTVYGYSFDVISWSGDTLTISVGGVPVNPGWKNLSVGHHSGEITATDEQVLSLLSRTDVLDVVIDNVKVWEKNGTAKEDVFIPRNASINILNVSVGDTVSWRTSKTSYYDSLFIYDVLDSVCVSMFYRDGSDNEMIISPDTLTSGDTTLLFSTGEVPAFTKVYLYVKYIGDNEAYLRSQIYWRE